MLRHFFLDKTNTIIKGSKSNTGLNPVMKLNYGNDISRGLIHFDTESIKRLAEDGDIQEDKCTFRLRMVNCFSVDGIPYEKVMSTNGNSDSKRACSFDLILIKLPQKFDAGRGFDFDTDFWVRGNRSHSEEGSSWYFSENGMVWECDKDKVNLNEGGINWPTIIRDKHLSGGIYDNDFISKEIEAFIDGRISKVVDIQHFDFGDENLNMDITSYVRDIIWHDECNYGLCLMFAPVYENMIKEESQYVGFFTDHTNTFFHPFVEMNDNEVVNDDRNAFCVGRKNRLYLYVANDGIPTDLDNLPVCSIDGTEYPVKKARTGTYYATIPAFPNSTPTPAVMYDNWTSLSIHGEPIEDIEMDFELMPAERRTTIGNKRKGVAEYIPQISGINDDEGIRRDETRTVYVDYRKRYSSEEKWRTLKSEYRLYVMDGTREYEVFPYSPIERGFQENFITINGSDMIPNEYHMDIKTYDATDVRIHKDVLIFRVVSDVTERYE